LKIDEVNESLKKAIDAMEGTARIADNFKHVEVNTKGKVRNWGLDELDESLFKELEAYELPERAIEAFLVSDAGPEAVISFTKQELLDWEKEKIHNAKFAAIVCLRSQFIIAGMIDAENMCIAYASSIVYKHDKTRGERDEN